MRIWVEGLLKPLVGFKRSKPKVELAADFQNEDTFKLFKAAGICVSDLRVVLQVLSSPFMLGRVLDGSSVKTFLDLWSGPRHLLLAHWICT